MYLTRTASAAEWTDELGRLRAVNPLIAAHVERGITRLVDKDGVRVLPPGSDAKPPAPAGEYLRRQPGAPAKPERANDVDDLTALAQRRVRGLSDCEGAADLTALVRQRMRSGT